MSSIVYVAIAFDEALVDPAIVLLSSMRDHAAAERPVHVYALMTGDFEVIREAKASLNGGPNFTLEPIVVENVFGALPRSDYISHGTYLRFLLPQLLPHLEKIIYLDVDMIVHREMSALFDTNVEGIPLAAVTDTAMIVGSPNWKNYSINYKEQKYSFLQYTRDFLGVGLTSPDEYFNAGLLLINLRYWRLHNVAEGTIDILRRHGDRVFMDQDALCEFMKGNYIRLDTRWNAFASCAHGKERLSLFARNRKSRKRWEAARAIWREDPWIIHYAGPNKPWEPTHPPMAHGDLWWRYAKRSPAWARLACVFDEKISHFPNQTTS